MQVLQYHTYVVCPFIRGKTFSEPYKMSRLIASPSLCSLQLCGLHCVVYSFVAFIVQFTASWVCRCVFQVVRLPQGLGAASPRVQEGRVGVGVGGGVGYGLCAALVGAQRLRPAVCAGEASASAGEAPCPSHVPTAKTPGPPHSVCARPAPTRAHVQGGPINRA